MSVVKVRDKLASSRRKRPCPSNTKNHGTDVSYATETALRLEIGLDVGARIEGYVYELESRVRRRVTEGRPGEVAVWIEALDLTPSWKLFQGMVSLAYVHPVYMGVESIRREIQRYEAGTFERRAVPQSYTRAFRVELDVCALCGESAVGGILFDRGMYSRNPDRPAFHLFHAVCAAYLHLTEFTSCPCAMTSRFGGVCPEAVDGLRKELTGAG